MSTKILAIDTSTEYGSVALAYGDEIVQQEVKAPKQHSLCLLSMIEKLLAEAGIQKRQLDAISFARGPGSFTGIRLATSVAQASAFSLDLPVIPVSTLQALAQQAWNEYQCSAVLAALDARLQQVYWGCYQIDQASNIMLLANEEKLDDFERVKWPKALLQNWVGVGNGWDHYKEYLSGQWIAGCYPKAYNVAFIARYEYQLGHFISALEVKPLYLRNQVAQARIVKV